jgi:hypothetical protein
MLVVPIGIVIVFHEKPMMLSSSTHDRHVGFSHPGENRTNDTQG